MSKDLVVLVADVQQEKTLETFLRERHRSLRMREVAFDIYRHPRHDAGVSMRPPTSWRRISRRNTAMPWCCWIGNGMVRRGMQLTYVRR